MDVFRLIAERKIQEAMDDGAFDNLAGRGQPLSLDEEPFEDPSLRMAHRVLRNNGFAPAWIEEGKDLEAAIARLREDRTRGRITESELRARANEINRRIFAFNLKAPMTSVHKTPIETK